MKFDELVKLAKSEGIYAGELKHGMLDEFLGIVYLKNNKFCKNLTDSEELSIQFAVPVLAEQ